MKLLLGWLFLVFLILYAFYYIDENLEKTVEVKDFIKISDNSNNIFYSVVNVNDDDNIIDLNLKQNSEVIVLFGDKSPQKNNVNLYIDRPNKHVILILNSKENLSWIIKTSKNTKIDLVIYDKEKSDVLSKNEIYKFNKNIDYFKNVEDINFVKTLSYLHKMFYIDKISHFSYFEELPKEITIDSVISNEKYDLNNLMPKEIEKKLNFDLISLNNEFIKFNLKGPLLKEDKNKEILNEITFSPDRTKLYKITENGLKIIDVNTKEEVLKPIPTIDKILNPKGIAYDTLSDRVFIANNKGKFFIFDANEEVWLSIRKYIDDFDINSLSYDEISNVYISLTSKKLGLIIFGQNGNFDRRVNLEDKLENINYNIKEDEEKPSLIVIPRGDDFAIVLTEKFVEKIWYYSRSENKAYLTYDYYIN